MKHRRKARGICQIDISRWQNVVLTAGCAGLPPSPRPCVQRAPPPSSCHEETKAQRCP